MSDHERPKHIWLLHDMDDGGGDIWCDDRNPTMAPDEDVPATEYVRADIAYQREAQMREALEPFARAARRYMDMADGLPDDTEVTIGGEATQPLPYVTLDDLRRAALKETESGE